MLDRSTISVHVGFTFLISSLLAFPTPFVAFYFHMNRHTSNTIVAELTKMPTIQNVLSFPFIKIYHN